ncbi:MAG: J domain-containing protein [Actinomycetota bacterium]|nr:J domain-containing protein [Actinomycetota bacterium]
MVRDVNHYEVLGVAGGDDAATIRRAYLAAARRHHPDFHSAADDATRAANATHMQRLNDSWAILSDPSTRAAYDRSLARIEDPGVARREARSSPVPPGGKGWTPRAGDDGWMTDFDAWADDHDDLAPDRPRSARRDLVTLLPVGLFALSIASVVMGGILTSRELLAFGVVALVLSIGLFVFLPVIEMTRGNRRR